MDATADGIGCTRCERFGGHGYRLDTSRDVEHPGGRVVVCECVAPHCTCGALKPQEAVPGPPYDELTDRAEKAYDERKCACWPVRTQVERLNRLLDGAEIPDLYRGKLINDLRVRDEEDRPMPEIQTAVFTVRTWIETIAFGDESKGIYLHGVPGSGKTLLACAALNELILLTRRPGLFVHLTRGYFQRLRNTYDDEPGAETTDAVFARLARVHYLVLDDIGVERGSPWEIEWLYNLIDERYQKRRFLIVTSNHSPDELRPLSNGRIASRLNHMCRRVKMPDRDMRAVFAYGL